MTDPEKRDAKEVVKMFSRVAPRYDKINRAMCLGLDVRWRQKLVGELLGADVCPDKKRFIDLACGSGDVCLSIARRAPNAEVTGVDFCRPMLDAACEKAKKHPFANVPVFKEADCSALPFPDASFDGATIAFGFRNFGDRQKCLCEIARVLKKGGKLAILEVAKADKFFSAAQRIFMTKIVPNVAEIFGGTKDDYKYLAATTLSYPANSEIQKMFEYAGFENFKTLRLGFSLVAINTGVKK